MKSAALFQLDECAVSTSEESHVNRIGIAAAGACRCLFAACLRTPGRKDDAVVLKSVVFLSSCRPPGVRHFFRLWSYYYRFPLLSFYANTLLHQHSRADQKKEKRKVTIKSLSPCLPKSCTTPPPFMPSTLPRVRPHTSSSISSLLPCRLKATM